MTQSLRLVFQVPLFRLLAVNLAIGTAVAVLLVGGLITLNLYGLRDLILADYSPAIALGLLLFGLFITFGSMAMGTAIMAFGGITDGSVGGSGRRGNGGGSGGNWDKRAAAVRVGARSRPGDRR